LKKEEKNKVGIFGIEFWALTLDALGTILIAVTALLVHRRVRKEHKIDKRVLKELKAEQSIGFLGIFLIALAYLLHLIILNS
jgi:hypothetical protein